MSRSTALRNRQYLSSQVDGTACQLHERIISDPLFRTNTAQPSKLLYREPTASNLISTSPKEVYGNSSHPVLLRTGNGGAGYTGILQVLCEAYLAHVRSLSGDRKPSDFRIEWVTNHSRYSLIALLGDIVDVALTYEPLNEHLALREGWARRVGRCFNDHFILVGPSTDPAGLGGSGSGKDRDLGVTDALRMIPEAAGKRDGRGVLWHSRGDGSATFAKETELFAAAGLGGGVESKVWVNTQPCTPYEALHRAAREGAYLLTDRGTFLTAQRDGGIEKLVCFVEGGAELLNPCAVMVKSGPGKEAAVEFAEWLVGDDEARAIVASFGKGWGWKKALFSLAEQEEFGNGEGIVGMRAGANRQRSSNAKL